MNVVRLAAHAVSARLLLPAVTFVLAGCLVTPASAGDGNIAASEFFPVFGPRLSGETVLWTVPRRDLGYVMKRGSAASGARESILTVRGRRDRRVALRWVASPGQVMLQHSLVDTSAARGDARLAIDLGISRLLPGGELERLASGTIENVGSFDLDGSVGVYPAEEPGTALVRDFSEPGSAPDRFGGVGSVLNIADRYLAWIDGTEIIVYDHVARSELYRVTLPNGGGLSDLQADGTVALNYPVEVGGGVKRKLGWASLSEPFLHELPVAPAGSYGAKLREDMVVFERNEGTLVQTAKGELGYVRLSGGSEKILASAVETAGGTDDLFDFDGRRVAWLDRTCSGARVRVAQLADLIAKPRPAGRNRCRLKLAGWPRLDRGGDLRLPVSCMGFERDCVVAGATLRLARAYRLGGKRLPRGTRVFAKRRRAGRASSTAIFQISPLTRRLLRRPGPAQLSVTLRIGDQNFSQVRRAVIRVR